MKNYIDKKQFYIDNAPQARPLEESDIEHGTVFALGVEIGIILMEHTTINTYHVQWDNGMISLNWNDLMKETLISQIFSNDVRTKTYLGKADFEGMITKLLIPKDIV